MKTFQPEYLLIGIILGSISVYFAKKRGMKRPYLYFLVGFFLGLIGIAFLFFGNKPRREDEPPKVSITEQLSRAFANKFSDQLWYYLDEGQQQKGPISSFLIKEKILTGQISSDTYLWNEELEDWKPLKALVEFSTNSL